MNRHPHSAFKYIHIAKDKSILKTSLTNKHSSKLSSTVNPTAAQPIADIDTKDLQDAATISEPSSYKFDKIHYNSTLETLLFLNATSGSATQQEVTDYNNYMNEQTQKKNAAKLAHDMCLRSQREFDQMSRDLALNPTRLIVQKTKQPIEAKYAGTNMFSVRQCSDITLKRIVPTLLTNSSIGVEVNGVLTSVNDLIVGQLTQSVSPGF